MRSQTEPEKSISVAERGHRFVRKNSRIYRENELWKIETPIHGGVSREELLFSNSAEVRYDVAEVPGVEVEEE